jgi:hypothetical protein
MLEHTDKYIERCVEIGILTKEPIRKYPLRASNLAMLLKAYAISTNKPYTIDNQRYHLLQDYKVYVTDEGLLWLYDLFSGHSLNFLKRTFQYLFINVKNIEEVSYCHLMPSLANFRGEVGEQPKAGSKQAAILVRSFGKNNKVKKEFHYPELRLARQAVLELTRFYPVDEFKLYRIRKLTKKGKVTYYREEVPILLEPSKRGLSNNLPNTRR